MTNLFVGQKVYKPKGYPFIATIVAEFEKLDGERRVVAESHMIPGLLHIFAPNQLEPVPLTKSQLAVLNSLTVETANVVVEADDLDAWAADTPVDWSYQGGTLN